MKFRLIQFSVYLSVLICAAFYGFSERKPGQEAPERDARAAAIDEALFTRAEFFGANAIVPFPTEQARNRLAAALENYPGDAQILIKLAELDERLGRFDEAEKHLAAIKPENTTALAAFYGRRAMFDRQAAALDRILRNSPPETRAEAFSNLIALSKKHDLKQYLAPEFYQREIARDDGAFTVLLAFVDKLTEEKNYPEALKILDLNKAKFPAWKDQILEKRIAVLTAQGAFREVEKAYVEAFDPFWSEAQSEAFYGFLREHDRYRAYESELRRSFRANPADFRTAIRLLHFPCYGCEEFAPVMSRLENARAARKIKWQADELLTLARLSIVRGDGDRASRFLYTLATDFDVRTKSELRRKVLYQLFEILSDAGYSRLALTRGNLDFYETIARSDARPGITTGILSLIFADTNPRARFETKQETAVKLFNQAAAYRIFQEFKREYPDAPELAQMYLDVIRLYTSAKKLEIAAATLAEFEGKYADFKDFPDAALKLSDAFINFKQFDKEREIYRRLLDFLGAAGKPKFRAPALFQTGDLTAVTPGIESYLNGSNEGISPATARKLSDYYYGGESTAAFRDHLDTGATREILYADVLARLVASLARENKNQEILDLYAAETAKYPGEEQLYEQMLQWLGQTNLVERQSEVYRKALGNFQTKTWKDRFARWLLRQKRTAEFEEFSRSMVATFDDVETQEYLKQFIDGKETSGKESPDNRMFFALYTLAHRRFPHNLAFVKGLLRYYRQNKMETERRALLAEYYFESAELREEFLTDLSKRGELPAHLTTSDERSAPDGVEALPYKLFRADAARLLSEFEKALVFYRELGELYPRHPEFDENYLTLARSFGQTDRARLTEAAAFAQKQADSFPANEDFRVRAGEIKAELGDYRQARENWQKIIELGAGENRSYLDTATVFWDYFQFDDALRTIQSLRRKTGIKNLYAYQAGAILEAKNETRAALDEYFAALADDRNEDDRAGAKRRLRQLSGKPSLEKEINAAYAAARRASNDTFPLDYHYADILYRRDRRAEAVGLLRRAVAAEKSEDRLLEARQFFRSADEPEAVRATLGRLAETAENPRDAIAYRLQLAESFRENYEPEKAAGVLADLVRRFPTNYGVLKETENFYWDLGKREKSIEVLRAARGRARGEYLYRLSRKLAQRLTALERAPEAERMLLALQSENPEDEEVFAELADLYVRTNRAADLRKSLSVALGALARRELEPLDYRQKVKDLREKMISAFTRLKDYDAAAEQYIEIINRDPEAEENIDQAIGFARRYGGGQKFVEYYRQTARESFKNYRWNVVLARLSEASGDLPAAVENYRTAIFNQPEMPELYEALGEIYLKMQNYQAALANLEKLIELSGEDKKYVRQKALILEKIGKKTEADAERAKLPAQDAPKPPTLPEQFAEAQRLRATETEKSIEIYRRAFENLAAKPLDSELRSADIAGYVQAVHAREPLDAITSLLWELREKLIAEIRDPNSVQSGRARANLGTLDAAFAEAVSREVRTVANGGEILFLKKDIETRLDATGGADESTVSLLHNLISKCRFGDLREKMLVKAAATGVSEEKRVENLSALVNFYRNRGDHRRVLETLEAGLADKPLDLVRFYARSARSLEETGKELAALEIVFHQQTADDELTNRYLEILYEKNRAALEALARRPARHQLQIINFLLAKKESALATEAIGNSPYSDDWKASRAAQVRLQFDYLTPENGIYLGGSLHAGTIGEMIAADATVLPAVGQWFDQSDRYGRWLFAAGERDKAEYFLAAGIERQPEAAGAQFSLGYFYHRQGDFARALEHFQIAAELSPDDRSIRALIGAAHFKLGEEEKAFAGWAQIIDGDDRLAHASLYLKTLGEFGQMAKAHSDLKPLLVEKLKALDENGRDDKAPADLQEFTRQLAKSFAGEAEKAAYFLEICRAAPENTSLAEQLVDEALVAKPNAGAFYRLLIERADGFDDYEHDYEFVSLLETSWETREAEVLYDGANDFNFDEPKNARLGWERKYLEFLLENRNFADAAKLVAEIEASVKGHYPRPVWLRLAEFRLDLNQNKEAAALAKMLKFTGIETSPNAQTAVLPNPERLNQAVEILRAEGRSELSRALREAYFARLLALGQYNAANFTGLARALFERGDSAQALQILRIMNNFAAEEQRAELDSLPLLAKFANKENLPVAERRELNEKVALEAAAEILSEYGFPAEAAAAREKLRTVSADDAANRIELARLYANSRTIDDSARILLEMIGDQSAARSSRWQSLLVLGEILGGDAEAWQKMTAENRPLAERDAEIWTALSALALYHTGQTDEALRLLENDGSTWELDYLKAQIEIASGRDAPALDSLIRLFEFYPEIKGVFGFYAPGAESRIIDLYLKAGKPRAALEAAKTFGILKTAQTIVFDPERNFKFKPLALRRRELEFSEARRLLEQLSLAAESVGDFSQAADFEKARAGFLDASAEKGNSAARIDRLKRKQSESVSDPPFRIAD